CATVLVQASFAPISIVTYFAPWVTACCACPLRAPESEPVTALLYPTSVAGAPAAFSRRRCEFTVAELPVDQLFAWQFDRPLQLMSAWVIESPRAAIVVTDVAGSGAAFAAAAPDSVPMTTS